MNNKVQYTCSGIFLILLIKNSFTAYTLIDVIALVSVVLVYCMYEFINNSKRKDELKEMKEYYDTKIQKIETDVSNTKDYMSKVSTNLAFKR